MELGVNAEFGMTFVVKTAKRLKSLGQAFSKACRGQGDSVPLSLSAESETLKTMAQSF
ncbi:MAG: hypothetical protein ACI4I1_10275 [Oscillospiraceae bacterium]